MRTAVLTALGFVFAAGSAWAQSSYDYRDHDDSRANSYSGRSYDSDRHSRSGEWSDEDHHSAKSGRSRGASFYMKHGDKEFRVRCGGEESARECVEAAMTMFRQVQDASRMAPADSSSTTGATGSGAASGSTTRQ